MPSITFPSGSILVPTVLVSAVQELSADLTSVYSTVSSNSASWAAGGGGVDEQDKNKWNNTFDTVSSLSSNWNSVYSTVSSNSSNWNSVYSKVNNTSANWDIAYSYVNTTSSDIDSIKTNIISNSSKWDNAYNITNSNSSKWDNAYNTLSSVSAGFGDATTWVRNNSSTMYVDRLGINTHIESLPSNLKLAVQGDTVIYGNLSSLGTTTLVNVTANVTDALSVVNPGFGSPNAIFIDQSGPGAGIRMQNNGSGPMMTLEGNGNVGIGTNLPNKKLTVVGDISSTEVIFALNGNSNLWNLAYSNVSANSGIWGEASNILTSNSAKWNSNYTATNSNSGKWDSVYTNTSANSSKWDSNYTTTYGNSSKWDNTSTTFSENSSKYDASSTSLKNLSSGWQDSYNATKNLSSIWSSASINYIIDGAGSTITPGSKGVIYLPTGFRVIAWRVMAETVTTAKLDVRRFSNNTYKLGSLSGDSLLIDSVNPNLINWLTLNNSASATGNGNIFAGISALDTLEFYVEENSAAKRFTVALAGLRTL